MSFGLDATISPLRSAAFFCDILNQEIRQNQRIVEVRGDFIALCPYAAACAL